MLGSTRDMENTWSTNTGQVHKKDLVQISSLHGEKLLHKYWHKTDIFIRNNFGSPGPMIESQRVRDLPSWWEFVQHLIHTPSYRSAQAVEDVLWLIIMILQIWRALATLHHVLLSLFHPLQLYSAFWKHQRRRENDCSKFKCHINFKTKVKLYL